MATPPIPPHPFQTTGPSAAEIALYRQRDAVNKSVRDYKALDDASIDPGSAELDAWVLDNQQKLANIKIREDQMQQEYKDLSTAAPIQWKEIQLLKETARKDESQTESAASTSPPQRIRANMEQKQDVSYDVGTKDIIRKLIQLNGAEAFNDIISGLGIISLKIDPISTREVVPSSILAACHEFLGEEAMDMTPNDVARKIRKIGREHVHLQSQSQSQAQAHSQASSPLLRPMVHHLASRSQPFHIGSSPPRIRSNEGSSFNSTSDRTSHDSEATPPRLGEPGEDDDIEELWPLKKELQNVIDENTLITEENQALKARLLRVHLFHEPNEETDITIRGYVNDVAHAIQGFDVRVPFFNAKPALSLADHFDSEIVPETFTKEHAILLMYEIQQFELSTQCLHVDKSLLAIIAHLPAFLGSSPNVDQFKHLFGYISYITEYFRLSGFGRVCHIMAIAYLVERSSDDTPPAIWTDLIEAIFNFKFSPYTDWGLLDKITFAWLVSKHKESFDGVGTKIENFIRDSDKRQRMLDLIQDLPEKISSFVELLLLDKVQVFSNIEALTPPILSIAPPAENQLVWMRTMIGESEVEYIWVRVVASMDVTFCQHGFQFQCEKIRKEGVLKVALLVTPISKNPLPWFLVPESLQPYFDKHHSHEFEKAVAELRVKTGLAMR